MYPSGIIPVYCNIPGQGWALAGVAEWKVLEPHTANTPGAWYPTVSQRDRLTIAGEEYYTDWLDCRATNLHFNGIKYWTLARKTSAIRLNGLPVNVRIDDMLLLLHKVYIRIWRQTKAE